MALQSVPGDSSRIPVDVDKARQPRDPHIPNQVFHPSSKSSLLMFMEFAMIWTKIRLPKTVMKENLGILFSSMMEMMMILTGIRFVDSEDEVRSRVFLACSNK
jgi:hypothetical protein